MGVSPTPEMVLDSLGLHLTSLDLVRYSPDEDYGPDNPALPAYVLNELPAAPDTALAASVANFTADRDPYNPDCLLRLRFRAAGDSPVAVAQHANAVRGALRWPEQRHAPQTWPGGVRVLDVQAGSLSRPVRDANGRWMRADTYRLTLNPGV